MRTAGFAKIALALVAAAPFTASAFADTVVPDGTVTSVATFNPTVSLSGTPSTYSTPGNGTMTGGTFEISGTGGFSNIGNTFGTLNGTLTFSNTVGTTMAESLNNFFVFSDNMGGTYDFSVSSVQTKTFSADPGMSTSFALYLLGDTIDTNLGYTTSTPTSLTISTNSTGPSAYASSLTLAIPPSGTGVTPEPTSLVLLGTGMLGVVGAARRRFSL